MDPDRLFLQQTLISSNLIYFSTISSVPVSKIESISCWPKVDEVFWRPKGWYKKCQIYPKYFTIKGIWKRINSFLFSLSVSKSFALLSCKSKFGFFVKKKITFLLKYLWFNLQRLGRKSPKVKRVLWPELFGKYFSKLVTQNFGFCECPIFSIHGVLN